MDEEEQKNNTNDNGKNGLNILNGAINGGMNGSFTNQVKSRIKSGVVKKIIKKLIIKSALIVLVISFLTWVIIGPIFNLFDHIKDMTLVNMGQALPNTDSSNYSTTTGIGGKIAGQALAGLKKIASAIVDLISRWEYPTNRR